MKGNFLTSNKVLYKNVSAQVIIFFLEIFYFQFNNFHAFLQSIFMKFIQFIEKKLSFSMV